MLARLLRFVGCPASGARLTFNKLELRKKMTIQSVGRCPQTRHSRMSWAEDLSAIQEQALAHAILDLVRHRQVAALPEAANCYFFIPNPAPWENAEAAMFAALPEGLAQQVRSIQLQAGGKCYAVLGDVDCLAFMPHAFHLGPPELTMLAADSKLVSFESKSESELAHFITLQLARCAPVPGPRLVVGLHFDSGDLLEVF